MILINLWRKFVFLQQNNIKTKNKYYESNYSE